MIPTPAELNRICHAISVEKKVFLDVGCFCCPQHGINKLYPLFIPLDRPVIWGFAALTQVDRAAQSGLLKFHYGMFARGEFWTPLGAALTLTEAFRDRGLTVEWSGDLRDTFSIRVDREAFAMVNDDLKSEFDASEDHSHEDGIPSGHLRPPNFAERVTPSDPLYAVTIWKDPHADRWWYNVSDRDPTGGTHEQRHEPTRSEALTAALALADQLRLEVN